jgi:hypothetical protein
MLRLTWGMLQAKIDAAHVLETDSPRQQAG